MKGNKHLQATGANVHPRTLQLWDQCTGLTLARLAAVDSLAPP